MAQQRASARPEPDTGLRGLILRQIGPLVVLLVVGWLILRQAAAFDPAAILAAARAIAPAQWLVALLATIGSFWAFGRFESVMHRLDGTGTPRRYARLTGIAAVGAAQLTGFGLLTGTLARWRMLPDRSLWQVTRLTVAVSVVFMACLGVLTALFVALTDLAGPGLRLLAALAVPAALALSALSLWRPRRFLSLRLPPVRAQARLMLFTAADTGFAALALYALLPPDSLPSPVLFYTVFLLALFAGLFGTTPGGVGPFEYMTLACLPAIPDAQLLAAIIAFRLVYFACPALFALALLVAAPLLRRHFTDMPAPRLEKVHAAHVPPVKAQALAYTARRAEAGLMRQGAFDLLRDVTAQPLSMVALTGQSLIMLSDPLRRTADPTAALLALEKTARDRLRVPIVYKCGARTAAAARAAGWRVLPVAQEAWVNPQTFDLDTPARRQLRRQLRKAEKSGVTVTAAWGNAAPVAEMRRLATAGADSRTARGFSMGRFCAFYVSAQLCYLAWKDDRLIGFLTFHDAHDERTLDLVCHGPDAPHGTMHLLVTRAIEDAARDRLGRLSLAAVPRDWPVAGKWGDRLREMTGAEGLRRFKTAFAPDWEPLYVAAPDLPSLLLGGIDLVDRITRPREGVGGLAT